ncbi:MAG: type II toxin-antitoxin system HicA family toxin [Chloroflexi bacterium]|nr:type II toxin-antitoxin system HicA family toxin [Chloroflexota bacterium]
MTAALLRDGFSLRSQRGSHQRYRHPDGRKVTVAFHHLSDTFRRKTLRAMIRDQAQWTEDGLKRLGLVK